MLSMYNNRRTTSALNDDDDDDDDYKKLKENLNNAKRGQAFLFVVFFIFNSFVCTYFALFSAFVSAL